MEFDRGGRRHGRHVDLASLVDIMFNLLLFFVITYNVTTDAAINIRLPESSTAETRAEEPLVITLTREGNIFLGEHAVAPEEISSFLKEKLIGLSEPSVRIKSDGEAPVGLLVKVVDGVRLSGCSAFSIATEKSPESQ
ncbi:MAG: biopolymer transporter ExbD [Syntrophobacteraceae bacterium]